MNNQSKETTYNDLDATYSPEDNKLRLYATYRLDTETYERIKAVGFRWAPKQELFVAPAWSPAREDVLLDLCGEIADEDISPEERAADRVERFSGYRDKRRGEAGAHADTFESSPSVFGNQSQERAERAAKRSDRQRVKAVTQWSKAEYWQTRTAGVIANALHKASARVRRGRILKLEAEARRSSICPRWKQHIEMRLIYENAMLDADGGSAANADIIPGGWIRKYQVGKVNRSNATGRVTSVSVFTADPQFKGEGVAPMKLQQISVERLPFDSYRSPTVEELKAYEADEKERKTAAKAKAKANPAPKLINPTPEEARKLQGFLNARAGEGKHAEPINSTQKAYSSQTGNYGKCETVFIGEKTEIYAKHWSGKRRQRVKIFKVRIYRNGFNADRVVILTDKPQKKFPWKLIEKAKSECPSEESTGAAFVELFNKRESWGYDFGGLPENEQATAQQTRLDAAYLGWVNAQCFNQCDLTDKGHEVLERLRTLETVAR